MRHRAFVNLKNARTTAQKAVMKEIVSARVCPFCPRHLRKFHRKPILKETKHWLLTENQWPYKNTRVHLLVIAKRHVEKLGDLPPLAGRELLELAQWAERKYRIRGGGLGIRFGETSQNGGTVQHLHAQIVAADITDKGNPRYVPVRFRVG